eukprot:1957328-Lingulodinium_polyedra.AAC.1
MIALAIAALRETDVRNLGHDTRAACETGLDSQQLARLARIRIDANCQTVSIAPRRCSGC